MIVVAERLDGGQVGSRVSTFPDVFSRGPPIMLWPIIGRPAGRLSASNNQPITDCLFQDAPSFNKSHVVTIVKSQWYNGRFVTLML